MRVLWKNAYRALSLALCLLSLLWVFDIKVLDIENTSFFDIFDYTTANVLMPIGGLFTCLFVAWKMKPSFLRDQMTNKGALRGRLFPLLWFSRPNDSLLRLGKPKMDRRALLRACTNGSSELMSNISMNVVGMLYNLQLMHYAGEDGIAAYGVIMYVNFVFVSAFLGYSIGSGIEKMADKDRYVTVKGLAEQEVQANKIVWPLPYNSVGNNLEELYNTVEKNKNTIIAFLQKNGITDKEIILSAPTVTDRETILAGIKRGLILRDRYTVLFYLRDIGKFDEYAERATDELLKIL